MEQDNQSLPALRKNNAALREQIEKDRVTGTYSACAAGRIADGLLTQGTACALLLVQIENLHLIRDMQGHLKSDEAIKLLAEQMRKLFFDQDVLFRAGDSEFAVFSPGALGTKYLNDKARRIEEQANRIGNDLKFSQSLHIAAAVVTTRKNDMLQTLLKRGRRDLQRRREMKLGTAVSLSCDPEAGRIERVMKRDLAFISEGMQEKDEVVGAYCQSYESFIQVYRFLKRGLERCAEDTYILLLTIEGQSGGALEPVGQSAAMLLMEHTIQNSLRQGDVYTKYSECQYLLLVLNHACENVMPIVERLQMNFVDAAEKSLCVSAACNVRMIKTEQQAKVQA